MKFKKILEKIGKFFKYFSKFKKTKVIFIESNQSNDAMRDLNKKLDEMLPKGKKTIIYPSSTATELKITKKWL